MIAWAALDPVIYSAIDEGGDRVVPAPELPIVVLSQYVEENYASELLADDLGGIGYVLKDRVTDVGHFIQAAERVAQGGTAIAAARAGGHRPPARARGLALSQRAVRESAGRERPPTRAHSRIQHRPRRRRRG
jgi:DNA-binding NarL/FixJ family response regulator